MIHKELEHFFDGAFGDERMDKRANKMLNSMKHEGSVVINRCCTTTTEKIGAYRMLNNGRMSEESIIRQLYANCSKQAKCDHVLCIQDTTEINFSSNSGRIAYDDADIGPVTKNSNLGFYCHPMLVIDAQTQVPLGFSTVKLWNRKRDKISKSDRKYKLQSIEEKESYRWIEVAKQSQSNLRPDIHQTIIADRESDIYEALCEIPNEKCDLLIRSSSNRTLYSQDCLLHAKMCSSPIKGTYEIEVKGNHSRKNRTAKMELRYENVQIKKPADLKGNYPQSIRVACIYVRECTETIPSNEQPIEWRLLTTHKIESMEYAMQCIEWYKMRWYIEEIFRLLKSEGMEIERAQLESGAALKRLALMGLIAAWHIMTLKLAHDRKEEEASARVLFTDMQIELLEILLKKVEGKTQKQKNPYVLYSLAWAAWIIARLAGWSGYGSHGKAGYITFKRGYQKYINQYQAFELFKDVYKE